VGESIEKFNFILTLCYALGNIRSASHEQVDMPFSDNLRHLRLANFLSQAELARQSGLHTITISRLEAGHVKPSTRTVRALAHALGTPPSELATPDEVAESDRRSSHLQARG
jgi:transcriptional regulator with XRE-family HTH domain